MKSGRNWRIRIASNKQAGDSIPSSRGREAKSHGKGVLMAKMGMQSVMNEDSSVVILQSSADHHPAWQSTCMQSVREWATIQGWQYQFTDDALFTDLPSDFVKKVGHRTPILADLGRLYWLRDTLEQLGGVAIWIDADTLCLEPSWRPGLPAHAAFGEEHWVQSEKAGGYRCFKTPHNAFMAFRAGNPILPFLIHVTESLIERVDPTKMAPQMVGPKLLKALHSLAQFELYPEAGALSPALLNEIVTEPGAAVACYQASGAPMPAFLNLCASLSDGYADQLLAVAQEPQRCAVLAG